MESSVRRFAAVATVGCLLSAAQAQGAQSVQPCLVAAVTNEVTGHFYEIYALPGIGWDDAQAAVALLPPKVGIGGDLVPGHLATITSTAEDQFVDAFRQASLGAGGACALSEGQVWVGGFQDLGAAEPTGGWRWVNDEGSMPGTNSGPQYTNWAAGEPNNSGPGERHLTLGRYGLGGGWNDEGSAPGSIGGYIVEYDLPRAAACTPGDGSCETIQGHTLVFPPGSFEPGDAISFNSFEFTDPRVLAGTCGTQPLTLFGPANGFVDKPELRIPAYLCGSPKFVVVEIDATDLDFRTGTVFVEHDTETVLPTNEYPDGRSNVCEDPIVQLPPGRGDPQYQDVVVWQTTDPTRMFEDNLGTGLFDGAAGEFTDSCGSSRAKVRETSYFVIGMRVDFGIGFEWATQPALNRQKFVELTSYKLNVLRASLDRAALEGVLKPTDASRMRLQLVTAAQRLQAGNPAGALTSIDRFLGLVNVATYGPGSLNYNGDHLSRGSNLRFMLRVKVIPYAP